MELFMDLTNLRSEAKRFGMRIGDHWRDLRETFAQHSSRDQMIQSHGPASVLHSEEIAELELLSESLHIDKEKILDGELSIRKEIITEVQIVQVPVTREELVIERRSADGRHTSEVLAGQQQLRIPISKERVLVKKEAVVSEVAKITRRKLRETKRISVDVRHDELRVSGEGHMDKSGEKDKAA